MKVIELPNFTVTIENDKVNITSHMERPVCPFCNEHSCYYNCDQSTAEFEDGSSKPESEEEVAERILTNAQIDVVESFILALVNSLHKHGNSFIFDSLKEPLSEAILTVLDAIDNN